MKVRIAAAAVLAAAAGAAALAPAAIAADEVTVMTRNIYLGADVGVALDLIPDMAAAAQFMWDQMQANEFPRRAKALAAEFAAERPAVVGLQEVAAWECRAGLFSQPKVIVDDLPLLLAATEAAGAPYVVAEADGVRAVNPGYSIPAIPWVTTVRDPAAFQPAFGTDEAQCGFTVSDVLLVRADLAGAVQAAGSVEYEQATSVVPVVMTIARGYVWADIAIGGTPVRFVSTHLEALSTTGEVPSSAIQARQLVEDLAPVTMPLVVLGDFNSDPRDPREPGSNPGGQPEVSAACPPQSGGDATCSAYWTMVAAGFADAGPDSQDPRNLSWGLNAVLAGPDPQRIAAAKEMGNPHGFTDRIDYVFVRNGVIVDSARLVGADWPKGASTWACDAPEQVALTRDGAEALGATAPAGGVCAASDHAGVAASLSIPPGQGSDAPLRERVPMAAVWTAIGLAVAAAGVIALAWTIARRRRRMPSAAP